MKSVMKKQNQQLFQKTSSDNDSLRNLLLQSKEFSEYLIGFEQWLRVLGYSASAIYYFPAYVRKFLYYLEQRKVMKVKRIKLQCIRSYILSLSKSMNKRTGNPLSRNYQLNHLNAFKRFSRYLLDYHNIVLDCSAQVIENTQRQRRWLTKKEIDLLYAACSNDSAGIMNRAILSVYYGLGLRRTEGVSLDIDDIYSKADSIYVRKGKLSKERYVPMTNSVFHDIEIYIQRVRAPRLLSCKREEERALFVSENGSRITGNATYARLQSLASMTEIKTPISLHSLRHSIATHLLSAGMKLENISTFLGHSSLESTQIYTHLLQKPV